MEYFGDVLVPFHTVVSHPDHGDVVVPHLHTVRFGQCSFHTMNCVN